MAQSIQEIKQNIGNAYISQSAVQTIYSLSAEDVALGFNVLFSKVSLESLLFYAMAFGIWLLQMTFETDKAEVSAIVSQLRPKRRYELMAKNFQYGFDLLPDSDQFDNTGTTDEQIAASKIVKYAAIIEGDNFITMKVAKPVGGDLTSLSSDEFLAFKEYMSRVKDSGVFIKYLTDDAEQLRLIIDIYYNPLLLKSDGSRVDGTSQTPVVDAVKNYLVNIEFDGTLILAHLTDALQRVSGVVIPNITLSQYKYGDLNWETFTVQRQPLSGYMRIADENIIINYIPRSAS